MDDLKNIKTETPDKQDLKSARKNILKRITNSETPLFSKIFPDILAGLTVFLTFILFYSFATGNISDGNKKDIIIYILGVLSTITTQIFAFYFGSSIGSKNKDNIIAKNQNNNPTEIKG
jgi:hypothetical protein